MRQDDELSARELRRMGDQIAVLQDDVAVAVREVVS
jgi:hypothetical protein